MVLAVYAFIHFAWTQQHSTQNMENWKIKTIMFLQSAMWFAEMSELTDEPCVGAAGGITLSQKPSAWAPHGSQAAPPLWGTALLSQKVGLSKAASPALCVCASSASFFLHRNLSECRKGFILMAIFLLGFLWLCSPQGGRDMRQSISWTLPVPSCSFSF